MGLSLSPELPGASGALLLAAVMAAAGCAPTGIRHTPPARPGGPLLLDARRADALGLTPAAMLSTLGLSSGDVARALDAAAPSVPAGSSSPAPGSDEEWLERTIERHEGEIDDARESSPSTFFQPIEDPTLRLVFVDQTVRLHNEGGRQFHEGMNLYLSNRSAARIADRLVLTANPEVYLVENRNVMTDNLDAGLRFQELALSARLDPVEVTVGRQPLWWGPGRHGSLLLSTNARPLDMVRVSTAGPVLLPGFLAHLGLLRGEVFASRLEASRVVESPYLGGMRLTSRVLPWLEVGASRTAMFGGRGRPAVTGRTILDVITARRENDENDPGDQRASIDGRVIVPWSFQPFEVYGEYGGEDEAGGFFSRTAEIIGLYLPRIGPWNRFELTVEYANTTVAGHPEAWYTSGDFPEGYTRHGQLIGHHVGTDGLDIYTELRIHPRGPDESLIISYDFEEHFRHSRVEEKLHQVRLGVEARAWQDLWVSAFYQVDAWANFQGVLHRDEEGQAFGVGARWEF